MDNIEKEIDFEELSKEYPLFFSSIHKINKGSIYPSPKIPKPISEDPQIFLDYDDYILDERISNLEFYPTEDRTNNSLNNLKSSKYSTETIVSPTPSKSMNISKHSSAFSKKSLANHHQTCSRRKIDNNISHHNNNIQNPDFYFDESNKKHIINKTNDDENFIETGVQTSKNVAKKTISNQVPPPSQSLHSGYPLFFDYQPKLPQRHQKLQNGTEKTFYQNGDILIRFTSGKEKIYHQNIILTKYKNGDILQEFLDGSTAYKYTNTGTVQLTLPDHTSIIQYANGQREKRNPEGETIVKFSDGVFMKIDVNGKWTMIKANDL